MASSLTADDRERACHLGYWAAAFAELAGCDLVCVPSLESWADQVGARLSDESPCQPGSPPVALHVGERVYWIASAGVERFLIAGPVDREPDSGIPRALSAAARAVEAYGRCADRLSLSMAQFRLFQRVGEAASSAGGAKLAMEELLSGVLALLQTRFGSVMLIDEEIPETMAIFHAKGLPEDVIASTRVRLGRGVAGTVAQTGEPVLLRRGEAHPQSAGRPEGAYESAICVPLRVQQRVIGVLNVRGREGLGDLTAADLELVQALAGLAGPIIEAARLLEAREADIQSALADLKRTNQLLSQAREQFERVLESAPSPAIVVDGSRVLMWVNLRAEKLIGLARHEVQFRQLDEGVAGSPAGAAMVAALDAFETGQPLPRVTLDAPVHRVFQPHVAPLHGDPEQGGGHVILFADVTEIEELSQLKTDLVSVTSHEFRTPLTIMKGAASTLSAHWAVVDEATRNEFLGEIVKQCDRLDRMTRHILDISRIEAGRALDLQRSDVEPDELIRAVVALQTTASTTHRIEVQLADALPTVCIDRDKVEQVLINLVSNAIKYSPDGGVVTVRAEVRGDMLEVSVADQGIGISEEDRARLFQRYQLVGGSRSQSIRGTGLGLYLSKGFVESHGGTLTVESTPGAGSTFTFTLPTGSCPP